MFRYSTVGPQQRISFEYDWQGRRIGKRVWNNTAGSGTPVLDEKYLYDGWNLLAELNATNNQVIRSYVWGTDLSGSMQGAGGVGGLLAINVAASTENPQPSTHFVCYDGNGNVVSLINAETGEHSARYEYGPFGEVIRATGPACGTNPFRFSTKYQDDETDLVYYGYRYYNASTGRWLGRDPIEEGGNSLYLFVYNCPAGFIDVLGNKPSRCNVVTLPSSPEDYALSAVHEQVKTEQKDRNWIVLNVEDIRDANAQLKSTKCRCIDTLDIVGHGEEEGGVQGVGNSNSQGLEARGNGTVAGLELFAGLKGKFCKSCTIILRGCNAAYGQGGNIS